MAVDKSAQRIRSMFGEIAGRYDRLNHLLSFGVDYYWRWRTVRSVRLPSDGAIVLDLCTGTGDLALAFCQAASGTATIVGADFCHEMLVLGEKKRQRKGLAQRMAFVEADAMLLPFPCDSFDVVSVAFGLRNVADTGQGLAEMARVCAVGGKVAVLEFSMPQFPPLRILYGWYFRNVLPRIGQVVSGSRSGAYSYLPASVAEFDAAGAMVERMRAAGLVDVKRRPLTLGIATLYIGTKQGKVAP